MNPEQILKETIDTIEKQFGDLKENNKGDIEAIFKESAVRLKELGLAFKDKEIDENDLKSELDSEKNTVEAKIMSLAAKNKAEVHGFVDNFKDMLKTKMKELI